jgi:hypothetical protein
MKRVSIFALLALLCLGSKSADAGWWHHHHRQAVYQAAPAYYMPMAPATVIQAAPQSGLADELARRLFDKFIGGIPTPGQPPVQSGEDMKQVLRDLQELKTGVKSLEERVENINSTVQRQGEAMGAIMKELQELKARTPATGAPANGTPAGAPAAGPGFFGNGPAAAPAGDRSHRISPPGGVAPFGPAAAPALPVPPPTAPAAPANEPAAPAKEGAAPKEAAKDGH